MNANGAPFNPGPVNSTVMDSSGEYIGATSPYPCPGHKYRYDQGIDGKVFIPHYSFLDDSASVNLLRSYWVDITTGMFTRAGTNTYKDAYPGNQIGGDAGSVYDPVTRSVIMLPGWMTGEYKIPIFKVDQNQWVQQTRTGVDGGGSDNILWTLLVAERLLVGIGNGRVSGVQGAPALYTMSLNDWVMKSAPFTGTPTIVNKSRWHRYTDGKFYTYLGDGTNTLYRMTPPTTAGGNWVFDTVQVTIDGGGTLPPSAFTTASHYNGFFLCDTNGCFFWISGVILQMFSF
jgi:hypothetical protein